MAQDQEKARYYAFLVYPDTAPTDWKNQLKETFGQFAISPLHTPDEDDPVPHYHGIYKHPNSISLEGARKVLPQGIFKNDYLIALHHPRVYQRYLIHLDDSTKQQFEGGRDAIETINGFPLDLSRDFSQEERQQLKRDVFEHIREYNICEYSELIDSLMNLNFADMLDCACCNTVLFNSYLTSKRNSLPREENTVEKIKNERQKKKGVTPTATSDPLCVPGAGCRDFYKTPVQTIEANNCSNLVN